MTNCVLGRRGFSLRTHSMPFMPGRLMSNRTTEGFSCGSLASAVSASSYSPTHLKPSALRIQPARISRAGTSSSTIATAMFTMDIRFIVYAMLPECRVPLIDDTPDRFLICFLRGGRDGYGKFNLGSRAWRARDLALPAEF